MHRFFNQCFFIPCLYCLLFAGAFLVSACKKEKARTVDFQERQLPTELNIRDFEIISSDTMWVAVGNRFGRGGVLWTSDGGENWQLKLDVDSEIRSFSFRNNHLYIAPIGNTIQVSADNTQSWSTLITPGWEFFTACDFWADSLGIVVGGENFGRGTMHRVRLNGTPDLLRVDTFQHELTDIHIIDDSICIAIGYGVILRSTDQGINWIPDKTRGDFYQDMHFVDSQTGYVAGDYGSIHKTTDGGLSWEKIKSGSTVFNTKNRLTKVFFADATHGIVVGQKSLCWLTDNGGKSWKPVEQLPESDFSAVTMHEGVVYIGAENGLLISFDFP